MNQHEYDGNNHQRSGNHEVEAQVLSDRAHGDHKSAQREPDEVGDEASAPFEDDGERVPELGRHPVMLLGVALNQARRALHVP